MDEAMDLTEFVGSCGYGRLHLGCFREVRSDRQSRTAKFLDFGDGRARAFCGTIIGENDIGAFLRKTEGTCPADIPAGPGDNNGPVGKTLHWKTSYD
jgi:hypothetical protein